MSYDFRMPDIGEGIAEVEIVDWLVSVGDRVHEDQLVVTVETDKSRVDMPTPVAGTLIALGAQPGDIIPVGALLFSLDQDDGASVVGASEPPTPTAGAPVTPESAPPEAAASPVVRTRVKAAPSVRRLADERGIDLASVAGTGPGGRVTKDDVVAASAAVAAPRPVPAAPAAPPPSTPIATTVPSSAPAVARPRTPLPVDERIPLRGLRRQIAKNMVEAWRTIPHIIDWRQADASRLVAARGELRLAYPDVAAQLTFVPLLVKIVATALKSNPLMNASLTPEGDAYVLHGRVNIGIATSTPDGLLVPVVRDADQKSVVELATETAELIALSRSRKASPEQLTGGTYTVNNLGALGGTMGTPIIRSPEVGILAFGRITETVVARGGQPAVVPMMTLSSVGDHRLHDGEELSAFTATVVQLIENPVLLLGALR
ncbi:MAG: catalytic domain of component of various dehydrogenase complexe [Blastococcus sp.]|jgi:pyruvate dehydrogenase E2 component (dihydrolipoamide acetyltransferase)|nr:catalytic domain of component of various dehydrogenase complexe [Blastococcus sp.]